VEVDLEAVEAATRLWLGQSGPAGDRQEAALELRVGEGERAPVEHRPQHRDPWAAGVAVERRAQLRRSGKAVLVGRVDGGLELVASEFSGEIEQCPARAGDGDSVDLLPLVGLE
jgi:hypothetical protein